MGLSLKVSDGCLQALDEGLVARLLLAEHTYVTSLERIADEVLVHSHLLPELVFDQICVVHCDCCGLQTSRA